MENNYRKKMQDAIKKRHSVREYLSKPLDTEVIIKLQKKIEELNIKGNLHIQLVLNEPKGFSGFFAYGKFHGVTNYFVMAGEKDPSLDERIGYYGEQLVLYAQSLGLNTCWAGLSYRKVKDTYTLNTGEKIACYIAVGYGVTQGKTHKIKTPEQVSNVSPLTPDWFLEGVESALLAPTAINQQKFRFEYLGEKEKGKALVKAEAGKSLVGYTKMDLGIARYHFEVGTGEQNYEIIS